ncbi:glutathione peroxidase [Sphingorhabdus sp. Alg239-R122]|uniref:glutathione peroxidase n=1 Tax=Sphingorhabdus sp. Alg239-R122 TaxID=2305989 RepID=UPI0013D9EEEF|nr:glutathione peroxidase [Sphingorhabdus sp. Alg239-R122]
MDIYDFKVKLPGGKERDMSKHKGKVLLIVNTASKCGFTPQYEGLESLHEEFSDKDFEILAFPCNQFGGQEPGGEAEIAEFCSLNYDVKFPLMAKIDVNGPNADPLWEHLKKQQSGLMGSRKIKWNFTKFLVNKDGKVVARYGSIIKPEQIRSDIAKLL